MGPRLNASRLRPEVLKCVLALGGEARYSEVWNKAVERGYDLSKKAAFRNAIFERESCGLYCVQKVYSQNGCVSSDQSVIIAATPKSQDALAAALPNSQDSQDAPVIALPANKTGTGSHHYQKAVVQKDLQTGAAIREFVSIKQASETLQINRGHISTVAKGNLKRKSAGGFGWEFNSGNVLPQPDSQSQLVRRREPTGDEKKKQLLSKIKRLKMQLELSEAEQEFERLYGGSEAMGMADADAEENDARVRVRPERSC